MGKPFAKELNQLGDTIEWAKKCDVLKVKQYLTERAWLNMVCVGSGGSFSACRYAAMLYEECCAMAQPLTPLDYHFKSRGITDNAKILLLSASGRNNDVKYAYKRAINASAENTAYICLRKNSPLLELKKDFGGMISFDEDLPNKKDGFLVLIRLLLFSRFYIDASTMIII